MQKEEDLGSFGGREKELDRVPIGPENEADLDPELQEDVVGGEGRGVSPRAFRSFLSLALRFWNHLLTISFGKPML